MGGISSDMGGGIEIGDFVAPAVTRRILILCGLSILAEGYDIGIMGAAILALKDDPNWRLGPVELGFLSSAALLGMLAGALLIGTLADRYGRRLLLMVCVGIFSLSMIGGAIASSPLWLGLSRLLGGIGMGGVIPLAAAFTIEYSPVQNRARNYGLMYCGYSLGILLVSLLAIAILPGHGWRLLFWLGGVPLLAIPLLWRLLPESFDNLIGRGRPEEARALARSFAIGDDIADRLIAEARHRPAEDRPAAYESVAALFAPGHLRATLCFWLSLGIGLLLVYGLGSWLPTLMRQQGYALGSSLGFLAVFSLCSAAGGIGGGMLADRYGSGRVIAASFLVAAVAVIGLSFVNGLAVNYVLVGLAGYGTVSTTLILTAYVTSWYPPRIRATAVGWGLGVGRIGAICGPLLGGLLLSVTGGSVVYSFYAFAGLAVLGAGVVLLVPAQRRTANLV
jgi:AAHS family benzoate transporter-like MFS transporter